MSDYTIHYLSPYTDVVPLNMCMVRGGGRGELKGLQPPIQEKMSDYAIH